MTLLSVRGLTKRFGAFTAVDGVGFDVAPGEVVAIIGPNGAGKSTCFNAINGQERPDAGTVLLDGVDVAGSSPARIWRKAVGRTFQVTATVPSMTVRENVQMALLSHRRQTRSLTTSARRLHRAEADALLAVVGLAGQEDRPCGIMAYGALKQLELAVALANEPRLLLMDEPTAGMAPAERGALMALVVRLCRERAIGVLFTEHDIDVVFGCADRVIVLNRGKVLVAGTSEAIRANAEVQAIYLGGGAKGAAS
jgi:branched-chain amino acid transport system ATP-binding protein